MTKFGFVGGLRPCIKKIPLCWLITSKSIEVFENEVWDLKNILRARNYFIRNYFMVFEIYTIYLWQNANGELF